MGRWMSPDPSNLGVDIYLPQTWNRYNYAINNPLTVADRNGMWPFYIHSQIIDESFPGMSKQDLKNLKDASWNMGIWTMLLANKIPAIRICTGCPMEVVRFSGVAGVATPHTIGSRLIVTLIPKFKKPKRLKPNGRQKGIRGFLPLPYKHSEMPSTRLLTEFLLHMKASNHGRTSRSGITPRSGISCAKCGLPRRVETRLPMQLSPYSIGHLEVNAIGCFLRTLVQGRRQWTVKGTEPVGQVENEMNC